MSIESSKIHHRESQKMLRLHKSGLSRIADIHVFSREGPVWANLLFKHLYIDLNCYQPSQAEELL